MKRGVPEALRLLGYGQVARSTIEDVRIAPRRVAIGGRVSVDFVLRSRARAAQESLVDLAVHFVKANGHATPKVFKLKRVALPARGRAELSASVSLAVHTTRKPQPAATPWTSSSMGRRCTIGAFLVVPAR